MPALDGSGNQTSSATGGGRIAVIGAGISGLSAAWLLNDAADVTLYEQCDRIGGHTRTVEVQQPGGDRVPVDMGFIVFNTRAYPNLTALFGHLGVASRETSMSLAISLDDGRFEYAGGRRSQLLAQPANLLRPRFWAMLRDIVRFYRDAAEDLEHRVTPDQSLGDYLDAHGYGAPFRDDHLLPMAAAIWSMPMREVLAQPAAAFIRFFDNHGLLKLGKRPKWRSVSGGSQTYVAAMRAGLRNVPRTGVPVVSVRRDAAGVLVRLADGRAERHDQAVIATHADQALALLERPSDDERRVLGAFRYTNNETVLHTDPGLMPGRRRAWASWNCIGRSGTAALMVTYWMNNLQEIPGNKNYFVTVNPDRPIAADHVIERRMFTHPVFDAGTQAAQAQLSGLQGHGGVWFCGSYFGSGFHEDGLVSGLTVAEAMAPVRRPWLAGAIRSDATPAANVAA